MRRAAGMGHVDHILNQKGVCESQGYRRLRGAGFIFSAAQANTQPLYCGYSEAEKSLCRQWGGR